MIPIYKPWITDLEKKYVQNAIESGWISSIGPYLEKFEDLFAKRIGVKYAIATNTGTAACHLALASMNFKPGDEIIIPAITFIATANAVKYCNCEVLLADIDPKTWNIDPHLLKSLIGPRTVAVFTVHLYGNPCNMNVLEQICKHNNLVLIEDACEALDGSFNGKQTGSFGKTAAFSFYGNKTITTGEGGMFVTNEREFYDRAKILKGQGQTDRYYHPVIGYNYRMTNIQAAIGLAQLERLDQIQKEKKRIFEEYKNRLSGKVGWPQQIENATHSYWSVTIRVPNPINIINRLKKEDVDARRVFYPISCLPPYKNAKGSFKEAELLFSEGISLPSYAELTNTEVNRICDIILGDLNG